MVCYCPCQFTWRLRSTGVILPDSLRSGLCNGTARETFTKYYSPHITSWCPQGMRVLRQCTVPRVEVMFVTIQSENIRLSKKEMNETYNAPTARCLQLGYDLLRLFIANQKEVFRPPACSVLPPHRTKDVYTPRGSTRDLWTVFWAAVLAPFLLIHKVGALRSTEKLTLPVVLSTACQRVPY
jgi:hypothetical protein